jgi:hypothetical protein
MISTLLFGTSPVQRGSVVVSVKASMYGGPDARCGTCDPGGNCRGNYFQQRPQVDSHGNQLPSQWSLVVYHHKGMPKGARAMRAAAAGGAQVFIVTDPVEAKLHGLYESLGRPQLTSHGNARQQAMYLRNNGTPFTDETLTQWWRELYE